MAKDEGQRKSETENPNPIKSGLHRCAQRSPLAHVAHTSGLPDYVLRLPVVPNGSFFPILPIPAQVPALCVIAMAVTALQARLEQQ